MCLVLKPQTVYKFYKYDFPAKIEDHFVVESPYEFVEHKLKPGEFIKSNRRSANLTKDEIDSNEIDLGLHTITTLKQVKELADEETNSYVIAEFLGHPKDFVASGVFGAGERYYSAVYTKLEFIRLVSAYKDGKKQRLPQLNKN